MDLFSFIMLGGGLAFFLYGMNVMSSGLERMAGGKLEGALRRMTSSLWKSLALGAGITIAIQSSSAMTVMLVGLVNSGIMDISQTVGVIMGSNIGTTLTAWLLSLVGLETSNVALKLLKPENFSLIFALVGAVMIMMGKQQRKKDIGSIFVGFAVLMYGMKLMSNAVSPLADAPEFAALLTAFENPLLGVLVGAVFTGIIQSSAASVGVLQALALTGSITYGMAIPIIMGQNIGTCVTALISSIGVSRNAKKVAIIHISFNLIGTVVLLIVYYALNALLHFTFTDSAIDAAGIAFVHSVFNVVTTVMLLPFGKFLVRIANTLLKDKAEETPKHLLDERLLSTPSVAIAECDRLTNRMAEMAQATLMKAFAVSRSYDEAVSDSIIEDENELDRYEDELGTLLVHLSSQQLSANDSIRVSKMLHAIGDFERLGDHALNIRETAKELYDKSAHFSEEAQHEMLTLTDALEEILTIATEAYCTNNVKRAYRVEPLEEVIDDLVATIKSNHIARLTAGECDIEKGFILNDFLNNFERVSDHCSNIAVTIIELSNNRFDTHRYIHSVAYNTEGFREDYKRYSDKYK
ncbi:MAG: Na/Pi cotransporter family protein, partial [Oscillospiraceae bacterium]|nr:Na/Pi cotransporter family protein [Oscillospiraceae bacterium]